MHSHGLAFDLLVPLWAALAFVLGQRAWRVRTTPAGAGFGGLVVAASVASLLALVAELDLLPADVAVPVPHLLGGAIAWSAAAALRVALLTVDSPRPLASAIDAALFVPAIALGVVAHPIGLVAWIAATHLAAAYWLGRLPRRSWPGFDAALLGLRLVFVVGGIASVVGLVALAPALGRLAAIAQSFGLILACAHLLPRLGLLSRDRVAHRSVIEAMSDGVVVVDLEDRLLAVNQAAREILALEEPSQALEPLAQVLAQHPDLVELFRGAIEGQTLYAPRSPNRPEDRRTFDLRLSALYHAQGTILCRVLVLRDISDRIAIEEENRRQALHVRLIHEVSTTAHDAETIDLAIEAVLALIARTLGFEAGDFLRSVSSEGEGRLVSSGLAYHRAAGGNSGATVRGADPDEVVDPQGLHWWRDLGFEVVATIPVLIGNRLVGVFEFYDRPRAELRTSNDDLLEHVGELVAQVIEKRLAEERVRRFAYRDDLTGLPNRQHFHQLLRAAVSLAGRGERRMALLFLDLDGFKKVNDTLGHEVGDRLLAEVATRFAKVVRLSDHLGRQQGESDDTAASVSRLGGDEFTVLLTEIAQPADAGLVAERLLATLERPIELAGQNLFMGTSIGIAVFPDDGLDAESLVRNADAAMYYSKGRGRNSYSFYSAEMNRSQSRRLEIEARLRDAIEREALEIHYQPILSTETRRVVAAEALLRWRDPEWGNVPPDEFIPVAEETGLIVALGQWVFRTVCAQARSWREAYGTTIRIGVNVSGKQIREPGMVEMVRQALEQTGVSPRQVELELTESTIMQDDALTTRTLRELKEMGIGLALDDFGTGYSSLSYLRRFTIDRVKIDRTFVAELPDNASDGALTSAIIAMAHGLKLDVVAEGVETEAQAQFLELRGCDEVQGYLFGRPCSPDEFVDWLSARPAVRVAAPDEKPEAEAD